jgi:hypothetical protein
MAKTYQAPFVQNQNIGKTTLINADTSLTAPTTAGVAVFTAGANGSKIDAMKVRALGTNVATVLRVFVNDGLGSAATNFSLVYELALPASTASATAPAQANDILLFAENFDNMGGSTSSGNGVLPPYLGAGQKLYVSLGTTVVAGYAVTVFGGDF